MPMMCSISASARLGITQYANQNPPNKMTVDPSIRIGDILTLIFFLLGGLGFAWSMRGDLKMLARDMQLQSKKIEKLETIITAQAVQTQRMDELSRRIDELQHGRGFITNEIDGLYSRREKIQNYPLIKTEKTCLVLGCWPLFAMF